MESKNAKLAATLFINLLNNIKTKAIKEIISSKLKKNNNPWATSAIINAIRNGDNHHMKICKHPNDVQLKNYYLG